MNIFGRDLYFLRRDTNSSIHTAVQTPGSTEYVTGCNIAFSAEKLADNLVARRPTQLPGKQVFCRRCGNHFSKLARVHNGEEIKDV